MVIVIAGHYYTMEGHPIAYPYPILLNLIDQLPCTQVFPLVKNMKLGLRQFLVAMGQIFKNPPPNVVHLDLSARLIVQQINDVNASSPRVIHIFRRLQAHDASYRTAFCQEQ